MDVSPHLVLMLTKVYMASPIHKNTTAGELAAVAALQSKARNQLRRERKRCNARNAVE